MQPSVAPPGRRTNQIGKDGGAWVQTPQGRFTDDKRVRQDLTGLEQRCQPLITFSQMIEPDRGINQNHDRRGRRRGGAFSFECVPPRRAGRRALSRSIKALRVSRTSADFSLTPVKT